jgi:hypothetical protein
LEALAADADKAMVGAMLYRIPQVIDWAAWDAASINKVLRTYWLKVELGSDLRPVRAEWRLPAEYLA